MSLAIDHRSWAALGCFCLLSIGCASTQALREERLESGLDSRLRASGIDPDTLIDPLAITREMREWTRERVPPHVSDAERLESLMVALTQREGLAVRYEREFTGTAREVFESGEANCLSFTSLFIALARDLGIDAYYLRMRRGARYEQEGDLVVRWEHVTAGWDRGSERKVLEFGFIPDENYRSAVRLSDLTALAMFYSNRGAELVLAGQSRRALPWLETAVTIDPEWSHNWLNLGVARRRLGDLEGAEAAYRTGLEQDAEHLQLYANLAAVLRLRGLSDTAGELLRLLDQKSNRNPYLYLSLGDSALEGGRPAEARRFYKRALHLKSRDANTQAAMGMWELAERNLEQARSRLRRAERLDPEARRAVSLREELEKVEGRLPDGAESLVSLEPERRQGRSFE